MAEHGSKNACDEQQRAFQVCVGINPLIIAQKALIPKRRWLPEAASAGWHLAFGFLLAKDGNGALGAFLASGMTFRAGMIGDQ